MLKRSVTKLTLAQRHEIGKKVAEICRCHACDFSTLTTKWIDVIIPILPTQTNNLSKFCSSNFLTCLIHQISSDFATVKILRYTVTLKMPNVVGENHSRITNYTVFVAVSSHFTTHSSCTNIYVGILGTGQEACSEEAFPLHQLVDEPQQVHQSTGWVLW